MQLDRVQSKKARSWSFEVWGLGKQLLQPPAPAMTFWCCLVNKTSVFLCAVHEMPKVNGTRLSWRRPIYTKVTMERAPPGSYRLRGNKVASKYTHNLYIICYRGRGGYNIYKVYMYNKVLVAFSWSWFQLKFLIIRGIFAEWFVYGRQGCVLIFYIFIYVLIFIFFNAACKKYFALTARAVERTRTSCTRCSIKRGIYMYINCQACRRESEFGISSAEINLFLISEP